MIYRRRARAVTARGGPISAFIGIGSNTFSVGRSQQGDYVVSQRWVRTYDQDGAVTQIPQLIYASGKTVYGKASGKAKTGTGAGGSFMKSLFMVSAQVFGGLSSARFFDIVSMFATAKLASSVVTNIPRAAQAVANVVGSAYTGGSAIAALFEEGGPNWGNFFFYGSASTYGIVAGYSRWKTPGVSDFGIFRNLRRLGLGPVFM